MRAQVFSETNGIGSLTLRDVATPTPGPGEVLIKVGAASLNYRDLLIAKGGYRSRQKQENLVPLSDGAGTIAEVSANVSEFKVGDRVTACFFQDWPAGRATDKAMESDSGRAADGFLQEFRVCPVSGLVKTPDHLSDAEAASLSCAGLTAWSAIVRHGHVQPGDVVLTQGTGGVSLFALQFAKLAGASVIITSSSDEKLDKAAALGADHGINYVENPEWGVIARDIAYDLTGGDGVDNVIELGGTKTMKQSLIAGRPGGTLSLIGVLSGATTGNVLLPFIISRDVRMQGVTVGPREDMVRMCQAISQSRLKPVMDQVFDFENAQDAYRHLESGAHFGKISIQMSQA